MAVWLSIRWVLVHFRTRFRMDYTDREEAELASCLFFFIWQKAQHFVFIVSIHKNNTHLTESIDVWNSYGKSKSTEYFWVSFTLIKKKRAGIAGDTSDLWGLRAYVSRSSVFRLMEQLFLLFSGRSKGLAASKQSLSRWIVDAIALAYTSKGLQCPLGVKAHSTRGMALSWAWSSGIALQDVCMAAGWASPSTFIRFYNLEVPALQARLLSV